MSDNYSYPVSEYYMPPDSPEEVLEEELRLYPDGRSYREGITTIKKIYGDAHFMRGVRKYTRLMSLARVSGDEQQSRSHTHELDIYAGGVVAVHAALSPMPKYLRRAVLSHDFLEDLDPQDEDLMEVRDVLAGIVQRLGLIQNGGWMDLLDQEPAELQDVIYRTAARVYEDVPNSHQNETAFLAGFMQVSDMVIRTVADEEVQRRVHKLRWDGPIA